MFYWVTSLYWQAPEIVGIPEGMLYIIFQLEGVSLVLRLTKFQTGIDNSLIKIIVSLPCWKRWLTAHFNPDLQRCQQGFNSGACVSLDCISLFVLNIHIYFVVITSVKRLLKVLPICFPVASLLIASIHTLEPWNSRVLKTEHVKTCKGLLMN